MDDLIVWNIPDQLSKDTVLHIAKYVFKKQLLRVVGFRMTERVGHTAYMFQLQLFWTDQSSVEVVVKAPTLEIIGKGLLEGGETGPTNILTAIHNAECDAYNFFMTQSTALPVAHCYGASKIGRGHSLGYIVMEDLKKKGRVIDLFEGLNLAQIVEVARAVGRFQGCSLVDQQWRKTFRRLDIGVWADIFKSVVACNAENKAAFPDIWTFEESDLTRLFDLDQFYAATDPDSGAFVPVLCHGDLWCNNILFANAGEDESGAGDALLAVVDWQAPHPGKCMEDLARLLCSSCSTEIRRNHLETILNAYYDELKKTVPADFQLPFSLDEALACYREMLPHGSIMMVLQLSTQTKRAYKDAAKEQKDAFARRMKDALDDALQTLADSRDETGSPSADQVTQLGY